MADPRALSRCSIGLAALLVCASAHATTRCPLEFGPKNPIIDVLGWLLVAVGVALGGLLFRWVIRRSSGKRRFVRGAAIVLGLAAMGLVWIGGFALAFVLFFFRC